MSTRKTLKSCYLRIGSLFGTWRKCGFKHHAEINPFRIIWVSPQSIFDKSVKLLQGRDRIISHVISGDWDIKKNDFKNRFLYRFMYDHFVDEMPWQQTSCYKDILLKIRSSGVFWHGCRNESDVLARCAYVDALYKNISENGYRLPDGISHGKTGIAKGARPQEVGIRIGRDGMFMHETGAHRLPVALLLGIELIPVRVVIRHSEWQNLRDRIVAGKTEDERRKVAGEHQFHPDIEYLL